MLDTRNSGAEGGAMDERQTRDHVQQHADAVARGDLDAAVADFCEELRPQAPQTTGAEVLSVEIGDSEAVAMISYSGDTGDSTLRSRWQDEAGRPVIVHVEPAS
jgi:hypothetical protein